MLTFRFGVSFSPCKLQGGSPQIFALTTLEAFGVGDYLSYSAKANAWCQRHREKLRNNIQNVWNYRVVCVESRSGLDQSTSWVTVEILPVKILLKQII